MASGGYRDRQAVKDYQRSVTPQDEDTLSFRNQSPVDQESFFLECSDPGILEAISLRGRGRNSSHNQPTSLTLVPPSINMRPRSKTENRWRGGHGPAAAIAVPVNQRRTQQFFRNKSFPSGFPTNKGAAGGHVVGWRPSYDAVRDTMRNPPTKTTRRCQSHHAPPSEAATTLASHAASAAMQTAKAAARTAAVAAQIAADARPPSPPSKSVQESPLQMFDRVLRAELDRIKRGDHEELDALVDGGRGSPECTEFPGIRDAAANLARAQAACDFDAAVRAADAAASRAPPEKVEEAALSGARRYRTDIVDEFYDVVPGDRLVEVLGYVAITRPDGFIDE